MVTDCRAQPGTSLKQAWFPVESVNAKLLTIATELELQQLSGQGVLLDSVVIDGTGGHSGDHFDSGGAESCRGAKESVPGVCQPQSVHSDVLGGLPPHDQLLPPAPGTDLVVPITCFAALSFAKAVLCEKARLPAQNGQLATLSGLTRARA